MREKLVKMDCLDCIIGLGPNLFYNSPMEACIIICRMNKRPERRGRVLFINAVNEVERKNAQSFLEEKHIKRIAGIYERYESEDGFAKVVTIKDMEEKHFSLSIPLYVQETRKVMNGEFLSVQEQYECWKRSAERMKKYFAQLNEMLEKSSDGEMRADDHTVE